MPELQGFPTLFQAETTNVPISGYLFSVNMEQRDFFKKDFAFFEIILEKYGGTCGKGVGTIDFSGGRCMI